MSTNKRIHPTAIIDPKAEIHETAEIGPYCILEGPVRIGARTKLLSNVVLRNSTFIGEDNVIHPFTVLGNEPQDLKYKGEKTVLEIGNRNIIRESVTMNIGTDGGGGVTKVGNENLIMAYVHLGHDVQLGNSTVLGNCCQIAGHAVIEDYVVLGGITSLTQFIRVGMHSYIGGYSGLNKDLAPFSLGRGISELFEVWGMNLVGLKRRGFTAESISALQEVNKIFYKDKTLEKEMALRKIEEQLAGTPVVDQFVKFVRSGENGVYR